MSDTSKHNPGFGALFRNQEDPNSPNKPHYSGTINIDGVVYRLAGWTKDGRNGTQYLSLSADVARPADESGATKPGNSTSRPF